ncbi:MAG TPA: ribonuclease P protein component [Candidatus Acidoferrales bacterium]|nr:ribonuclease P protein component [Candidatus Acidoferrales bacterium]
MGRKDYDEANLSTEQREAQANARLSCENGHSRREKSSQTEKGQRPQEIDRGCPPQASPQLSARRLALKGERFPKTARLTKRSEFQELFRTGKRVHTAHFILFSRGDGGGESRLGITVSAKVGKAVTRNRLKRLLREFFRRHRRVFSSGRDYVIVAKKNAAEISWPKLRAELEGALSQRKTKSG